jgi:hypothetical protein
MHMVVDQPGDDSLAAEIDPSRGCSGKPPDVLTGADRHDSITPNGDGLGDRESLVNRDDFSVRQNQIHGRGLSE